MKLKPLHDRVLIRRIEGTEKTKSGIIIPDTAKEKPQEGKRDDQGKVHALEVKKGDRVLFGKYSGNEVKIEGEEYVILREDEILGVIQ
ncbi:MAG: co-chaperone GroES [Acidobacteria bacterium]|nr:co-chaperone GroES [Acidobacteriota bacterium]